MNQKLDQNSKVVIVGGGMAGLFAATMLHHIGVNDITIIEKSDRIGGLLQSVHYKNPLQDGTDYEFDYGTHFVLNTGDLGIDRILQQDLDEENYYKFSGSLPEGQYTNSQLYKDSGCANVTLFSDDVLSAVKEELGQTTSLKKKNSKNLSELYTQKYGKTVVKEIYGPSLKKFTGENLENLDVSLETTFSSGRLIISDRAGSISLKKQKSWDDVAAFAHHQDSHSSIIKYYPKNAAIQKWIDDMEARLLNTGVKILKSSEIASIVKEGHGIKSLEIKNGDVLSADYLIWTLPPIFLAKMLSIDVPSMPPKMRSVSIVNILTDKKPIAGPYWLTIYDPAILSYRVTLYDNFTDKNERRQYRITVEILHGGDFSGSQEERQNIFKELQAMKIIPDDANLLWSEHEFIPAGFPVLKPGDAEIYDRQVESLHESLENVHVVSRYRGGAHGQIAIMQNIYHHINSLSQKKVA